MTQPNQPPEDELALLAAPGVQAIETRDPAAWVTWVQCPEVGRDTHYCMHTAAHTGPHTWAH